MSDRTLKVFVVDDDPAARMIIAFPFRNFHAEIAEFADGDACLDAMDDAPDIVVLDINMPGTDGLAVCRGIRAAGHGDTQVIFVSAYDDLETRLAAYDAGGDDYVVKPFAPEELGRKIAVAQRAAQARQEVSEQVCLARQVAFSAMSSMGEMGVLLEFLRSSFVCQMVDELGIVLCSALEQYGLRGIIELRDAGGHHCYSVQGSCTALETSILGNVRGMERIFQFRDRLVINYPMTTLLISNLPLDDEERMGRLRDHLAVLVEGAEARFVTMLNEERRIAQAAGLIGAAAELTDTMSDIDRHQESQRVEVLAAANDHMLALTRAFVHLGLTERQEESLARLAQEAIDRIVRIQDSGLATSRRLKEVTAHLKAVAVADGDTFSGR